MKKCEIKEDRCQNASMCDTPCSNNGYLTILILFILLAIIIGGVAYF